MQKNHFLAFLFHPFLSNFHFYCKYPFLRFKDGEELPASDRIQLVATPDGHIKLRIEEATPEDCGAYKLVVENALGADSSICAVAVNRKYILPLEIFAAANEKFTNLFPSFICVFTSLTFPTIFCLQRIPVLQYLSRSWKMCL